jgi:sulfite exporter TauE/SafE
MTVEFSALVTTAGLIGFLHTIFGPDHYVPFVMMAWARKWSALKTTLITVLCGVGHIASSVALGFVGVAMGLAVKNLKVVESVRGNIAAWLFIAFGLAYLVWGLRQAYRKRPHEHSHIHISEDMHTHPHSHDGEHTHVHRGKGAVSITPWVLFVICVFGPCEPLIPMLMYPAAKGGWFELWVVTGVFGVTTIGTMVATVLLSYAGVNFLPLGKVQRFSHALAGATICLCGLAIVFLGL